MRDDIDFSRNLSLSFSAKSCHKSFQIFRCYPRILITLNNNQYNLKYYCFSRYIYIYIYTYIYIHYDCIAMIDFDDTIVERTLCRTLCSSSCIKQMFINTKNVHNTHIYILHAYTWGLIHRLREALLSRNRMIWEYKIVLVRERDTSC